MKPGALNYVRPTSMEDAVALLSESGVDTKVMAGGQSLMPMLNLRMVAADRLIDVRDVVGLADWFADDKEVRLGACVTHEQIQLGEVADPSNGLMPAIAAKIAYQAVRNRGTIGGSLALADPAADWLTTTAALGAIIEWQGPQGKSSCPAEEFVVAAYTTRLDIADILTSVRIPRLPNDAAWGTDKLCRKTGEFAHAMAIVIRAPKNCRAFLGATDGAPIRLGQVESLLADLRDWRPSHAGLIADALDSDLAASGRELNEVKKWQSRSCLTRSVLKSFGANPVTVEIN
jgi:aerobic carbon-monoxide dehydrogenase medium subunit